MPFYKVLILLWGLLKHVSMLGCAQNISLNFTLFQHLFSQSVKKALISYGLYEAPPSDVL